MARRSNASVAAAHAAMLQPQPVPVGPIRADIDVMMPDYPERQDGWNEKRLQRFFDALCHTGCIVDACRVSTMSTVAARRAKAKYPLFSDAWDAALAHSRPALLAIAHHRATVGKQTIIIRNGKEHERKIEPSDAILKVLLARGDHAGGGGPAAADVLTFEEWQAGLRFGKDGSKVKSRVVSAEIREANLRVVERLCTMRERIHYWAEVNRGAVPEDLS